MTFSEFRFSLITLKELTRLQKKIRQSIIKLPDSFTIDELIDQLIFIEKIEKGFEQSKEGKVLSNEDVKKIIEKWSK